jgi:hypothetical protein
MMIAGVCVRFRRAMIAGVVAIVASAVATQKNAVH